MSSHAALAHLSGETSTPPRPTLELSGIRAHWSVWKRASDHHYPVSSGWCSVAKKRRAASRRLPSLTCSVCSTRKLMLPPEIGLRCGMRWCRAGRTRKCRCASPVTDGAQIQAEAEARIRPRQPTNGPILPDIDGYGRHGEYVLRKQLPSRTGCAAGISLPYVEVVPA